MVNRQIAARGVHSKKILNAMRKVPRKLFLPKGLEEFAYEDSPLPIDAGQTISLPYIVAFMAEGLALEGGENVQVLHGDGTLRVYKFRRINRSAGGW